MECLQVGLDRLFGVKRSAVSSALDEGDARDHRKPMKRFERIDHRLFYQTVDQQSVLIGVDIRVTATGNHKMQTVWRDRAVKKVVRRARSARTRLEIWIGQGTNNLCLVPRRLSIRRDGNARCEAPRVVREGLGGRTGKRRGDPDTHCAGE